MTANKTPDTTSQLPNEPAAAEQPKAQDTIPVVDSPDTSATDLTKESDSTATQESKETIVSKEAIEPTESKDSAETEKIEKIQEIKESEEVLKSTESEKTKEKEQNKEKEKKEKKEKDSKKSDEVKATAEVLSSAVDLSSCSEAPCSKPGELLRRARKSKGISIEKAAEDLNFLPSYIKCLEKEDFKPLHNTTFIKGYLRSYSRYLNVDSDQVMRCLAQHHPELAAPDQRPPVKIMKPEKNSNGIGFKILSILVILTILAIIILWWQNSDDQLVMNDSFPPVKVETLEGRTINAFAAFSAEMEDIEEDSNQPLFDTAEIPVNDENPLPATPQEVVAEELPKAQPLPANHKNGKFTGDLYAMTQSSPDRIGAIFAEDCWVEIRDVNKKLVFAGLMRGKEQLLVAGKPPFRSVFGRSRGMKLIYQGEEIDFKDKIRPNGYAAITVGS